MPFVRVRTLEEAVAPELRPWRVGASVFGLFGALALVVTAIGTYSVIQFGVTQRRHEFGVRIALGARARQVVEMIVGDTLRMTALAGVAGLIVVLGTGRFVEAHLFETSPRDPTVLAVAAVVLVTAALLATIVPAVRAAQVDPLLRSRPNRNLREASASPVEIAFLDQTTPCYGSRSVAVIGLGVSGPPRC